MIVSIMKSHSNNEQSSQPSSMQSSQTSSSSPQLSSQKIVPPPSAPVPPPPPPPPLTIVSNDTNQLNNNDSIELSNLKKGIVHDTVLLTAKEQAMKALQIFAKDSGLTEDQCKDYVFLSSYRPVKPIIQNGPLCGMVALAMAAELLGSLVSTEEIYEKAVNHGFSLQGEIFSANFMKELSVLILNKGAICKQMQESMLENISVIIKSLLNNNVILMPYDADKNHGPCEAKGHKAHWALIAGFFIVFKTENLDENLSSKICSLERDSDVNNLYYWNSYQNDSTIQSDMGYFMNNVEKLKVFSHQGKSKYCGIWDLEAMLKSNKNLVEIGPDRNTTEYMVPVGGIQDELCSQVVFINS